jgi:hypothetical protein
MGIQILLLQINFRFVLMVVVRRFVRAIFVPTAAFLIMAIRTLSSQRRQAVRLHFPSILVLLVLLMVID